VSICLAFAILPVSSFSLSLSPFRLNWPFLTLYSRQKRKHLADIGPDAVAAAESMATAKQKQDVNHQNKNITAVGQAPKSTEEMAPVRSHSLPHDVQALCKRVSWLEHFYEILYACQVEGVDIPFTLMYQYSRPYAAFFTDNGQIRKIEAKDMELPNPADKKTATQNQSITNILEAFVPVSAQPARVMHQRRNAMTIHDDNVNTEMRVEKSRLHKCHTGIEAMRVFSRDPVLQGDRDLVVEYQTAEDAENFLLFRPKDQNGIIQRFVQPSTPKVISYRLIWTSHHVQIETVCNNHLADMKDLPVERRCCTFDGLQNDVSEYPLNKAVERKILEATDKIVVAVKRIMPKRLDIQVMVLHFKASSGGKVWLLYCSSLRLMDGSDGAKTQKIGVSDAEMKRRLYAVTTGRPRTARAEEPQLPPAKGRASKKRKGRVCVLSGTSLGKDGHLKYNVTFQDIMVHFLWHGLSTGFEKIGNKQAASKALQDEERVARFHKQSSSLPARRCLRKLLTGDPSNPLLFVKDAAAATKALDDDKVLKDCYKLWQNVLFECFSQVIDNLDEETFESECTNTFNLDFLQHNAPVCEDVLLEFSSTLSELLVGWDESQQRRRDRHVDQMFDQIERPGAMSRPGKENMGNTVRERSRRSVSCPPGQMVEINEVKKSVKWAEVEEQRMEKDSSDEYGFLSGKEAQELAQYLMKANPFFFGTMQGNRWRHPRLDADRFLRNEVNHGEYLYWFHLYASVGLRRLDPTELAEHQKKASHAQVPSPLNPTLSFEPGKHMTFNDVVSINSQMSAIYLEFSTFRLLRTFNI
jgi:hypothetical protein